MAKRRGILGVKDQNDYTAIVKRKPGLLNKWRWGYSPGQSVLPGKGLRLCFYYDVFSEAGG